MKYERSRSRSFETHSGRSATAAISELTKVKIPPEYRSSAEGYLTMVGFFFGGLSGICMGWLSDRYGVRGFEIGFAIMGGAYAVGALATALSYFCFFRKVKMEETA